MVKKMPERFKRSRSKGAKLPDGVICVTRPGRWGNPYPTREQFWIALRSIIKGNKFPRELIEHYDHMKRIADSYHELTGQDLACWCSLDSECHADDLLRVANDNCWLAFSKKHLSTEPAYPGWPWMYHYRMAWGLAIGHRREDLVYWLGMQYRGCDRPIATSRSIDR